MVAVATRTDLKLPARTRSRIDQENDIQRSQKPHDIRSAIPLVDYTNPAKFPPYQFREYPKMPLLDGNRPIVVDDAGAILVFYDAADEVEFKEMNPEIAEEIDRNAPPKAMAERFQAMEDEISELRERLRAAGIEEGKPAPKKNGLAGLTQGSRPRDHNETEGDETEGDETGGLREQVKDAADRAQQGNVRAGGGNPLRNKKRV